MGNLQSLQSELGDGLGSLVAVVAEVVRIFPDGLITAVAFFAILTLSFSYGMFFIALLEGLLVFHGLRNANNYFNVFSESEKTGDSVRCRTGYTGFTLSSLSLFGTNYTTSFPSAPLYIVSLASSYLVYSMSKLSKELEVLGLEYSSRFYTAGIGITGLLLVMFLYRVGFGCESLIVGFVSVLLGGVLGLLLVEQNKLLFGEMSINLVGVPLLRERTADGSKLYVCPGNSN